ncbi:MULTISPECIES: hypothetical protein [unclassified Oceanobacillus]|uniref:hypothetical protein n=1 Tax=unclassified Oceanobacillus TaxID=2630292 RepID=UPI00300DD9F8
MLLCIFVWNFKKTHSLKDCKEEIKHKEGFIIHVKVPAERMPEEKRLYQATELAGRIDDIQVIQ